MSNLPFKAFAFDFDGTLVDTLWLHYEAYRVVFEDMALSLTEEQFYSNIGGKAAEAIPLFLGGRHAPLSVGDIHARKKQEIERLFETAPIRVFPAARLLGMFYGRVPMALVSSGSRPGIMQLLERLGWARTFDVVVTGEDTTSSKPDPAPYLLAAKLLGVPPDEMAAFEDTAAGCESAKKAGMAVFDVSNNSSALLP
jgi:beta-phosphoglucomutase-like phosphatase (HAD superfamily)